MERTFINDLNDEWRLIVQARSSQRRMRGWAEELYAGFRDLGQFMQELSQSESADHRDDLLRPLVRRASHDELAARVALQAMLPSVQAMAATFRHRDTPKEVAVSVVAAMSETIATYPLDRRPTRIAANLTFDTKSRLLREGLSSERREQVFGVMESLEELGWKSAAASKPTSDPATEVVNIVSGAVRSGRLDRGEGKLLIEHRVLDVPLDQMPELAGLRPDTQRRYRLRAEKKLQAAAQVRGLEV